MHGADQSLHHFRCDHLGDRRAAADNEPRYEDFQIGQEVDDLGADAGLARSHRAVVLTLPVNAQLGGILGGNPHDEGFPIHRDTIAEVGDSAGQGRYGQRRRLCPTRDAVDSLLDADGHGVRFSPTAAVAACT